MSALTYLSLQKNSFCGALPNSISNLRRLRLLNALSNSLTGSLPSQLGSLLFLTQLVLSSNSLSGVIPTSLIQLFRLVILELSSNSLTGTLPDFGSLHAIEVLSLFTNRLQGSLSSLGDLSNIRELRLSSNRIKGVIPSFWGNFSRLKHISLADNELSGSIPFFLAGITFLNVSGNRLSGELNIFGEPEKLRVFAASENCFNSISDDLCTARNIEVIVLNRIDSSCPHGHSWNDLQYGSLPQCLWSLPYLNILSVAGNNLRGYLPAENVSISEHLAAVNIGYNMIRGLISEAMAQHSFDIFRIESNLITGYLKISNFTKASNTSSYGATSNRLSGPLSTRYLDSFANVDILDGNIFTCGNFPKSDHLNIQQTYSCGSENLDKALYFWGFFCAVFAVTACTCCASLLLGSSAESHSFCGMLLYKTQVIGYHLLELMKLTRHPQLSRVLVQTGKFLIFLRELIRALLVVGLCSITTACVVYASFKLDDPSNVYKTHTEQYSYLISAAYLSGSAPATVMLVFFVATAGSLLYFIISSTSFSSFSKPDVDTGGVNLPKVAATWGLSSAKFLRFATRAVVLMVLGLVPLCINSVYVSQR